MFKSLFKKLSLATLLSISLVSLQGCVTAAVVGTVAAVATVTKIATDPRTTGTQIDDETLEEKIHLKLNKDPQLKQETRIEVVSYGGNVLLVGQAPDLIAINTAQSIVAGVDSVKDIYNEIRIGHKISTKQIAKDAWITTKANTELLANRFVKSNDVKVYTENGEVFLMGNVTPRQANIIIAIIRHIDGVKKVITAFNLLK